MSLRADRPRLLRRPAAVALTAALALTIPFAIPCEAGVHPDAATTGLSFLKIDVGSRAAAMGGAHTSACEGAFATYWNPALLIQERGHDLALMHSEWFQDIRYEYAAFSAAGDRQALGLSAAMLSLGDIDYRIDTRPDPIGQFSAGDYMVALSYARSVQGVKIGATIKAIHERIYYDTASGVAGDIGIAYEVTRVFPGVRLGGAIRNLGPKFKFREVPFKLPTQLRAGVSYHSPRAVAIGRLVLAADVIVPNDGDTRAGVGAEYDYDDRFQLRGGYLLGYDAVGLTAGMGVKFSSYRIDYAFVPYRYDLGTTHRIALGVSF
jgi:hypothetical protein